MAKIFLVCHGQTRKDVCSIDNVKAVAGSGENLSFADAIKYMCGEKPASFSSAGIGDLSPLLDPDCRSLFGQIPTAGGPGIQAKFVYLGHIKDDAVYVLRGSNSSLAEVGIFATRMNKDVVMKKDVVLVCCRGSPFPATPLVVTGTRI